MNTENSSTVPLRSRSDFSKNRPWSVKKNGLYLNVTTAAGEPIEGLADTLQAEVIYCAQTMALTLIPAFDEPGTYTAMFFPMAEGDYTFRIFGELEGTAIYELFTSSPEGFDAVESREPYEFPKPLRPS